MLEKNEAAIACEISVTTGADHKLGNIHKCLSAGFTCIVVLATDKRALVKIARDVRPVSLARGTLPISRTEGCPTDSGRTIVRGYKLRVKLNPTTIDEQKAKKQVIAQTILSSMRRLKEPG
ncbi:MAG TPA: hypothetical protein VNH18_33585 [Bryobacteraceae bacterium]|nr:hypothetical protein [Bryobacteraceae bacterium]